MESNVWKVTQNTFFYLPNIFIGTGRKACQDALFAPFVDRNNSIGFLPTLAFVRHERLKSQGERTRPGVQPRAGMDEQMCMRCLAL
jgi:hypothetical protein